MEVRAPHNYPEENARQDLEDLQALHLRSVSTADLLLPAFDPALVSDLTAYDAVYVALAGQLHVPLITADAALVRKLGESDIDARLLTDVA